MAPMENDMSEEMGLFEVMYNCRAMRKLKREAVPEELLIRLVGAGNQAASGSNLQMARWIVVRDPAVRAQLATLNKASVMNYIGPNSSRAGSVPHQSDAKRKRMLDAVLWQAEHLQELPALIIACMLFPDEVDDKGKLHGAGSIWPGVQNVLLAARALGLGATPTTLGLLDRKAVKKILAMPANMEAYCLIPVGWPSGRFGPVNRLPVETVMRFDRWS
jgi:nitroreductase